MNQIIALLSSLLGLSVAFADEASTSGTIKSIDLVAQTVTIATTAKGKAREVMVDLKPASCIVRFVRTSEPAKTGFVEQSATLSDLKPGWTISMTAKHDGGREAADLVKVRLER
jgi:hypothetical protein